MTRRQRAESSFAASRGSTVRKIFKHALAADQRFERRIGQQLEGETEPLGVVAVGPRDRPDLAAADRQPPRMEVLAERHAHPAVAVPGQLDDLAFRREQLQRPGEPGFAARSRARPGRSRRSRLRASRSRRRALRRSRRVPGRRRSAARGWPGSPGAASRHCSRPCPRRSRRSGRRASASRPRRRSPRSRRCRRGSRGRAGRRPAPASRRSRGRRTRSGAGRGRRPSGPSSSSGPSSTTPTLR